MIKDKINKIHNSIKIPPASEMCLLLHDATTNWVMSLVCLQFKMICRPYKLSAEGLHQYQDFPHRTRGLNIKLCYDGQKWFLPWCVHLEPCLWLRWGERRFTEVTSAAACCQSLNITITNCVMRRRYWYKIIWLDQKNSQIHYTWISAFPDSEIMKCKPKVSG